MAVVTGKSKFMVIWITVSFNFSARGYPRIFKRRYWVILEKYLSAKGLSMKVLKWFFLSTLIAWGVGFFLNMYADNDFKERKQEHISNIRLKLDNHDYSGAVDFAEPYLRYDDPDIKALYDEAQRKKAEQSKQSEIKRNQEIISSSKEGDYKTILQAYKKLYHLEPENSSYQSEIEKYSTLREKQLLAELKTIPASQYSENLSRYNELKSIKPGSNKYQEKSTYYENKIKEQEQRKQELAEAVQHGKFSAERLVQSSLKNPDSYEHVNTKYLIKDDSLIFLVKYRGTNSFNAVVTNISMVKTNMEGLGARIITN